MAAAAGLHHTELGRFHPAGRSPTVLSRAERQTRGAADMVGNSIRAGLPQLGPELAVLSARYASVSAPGYCAVGGGRLPVVGANQRQCLGGIQGAALASRQRHQRHADAERPRPIARSLQASGSAC
jgi:hypothetical protein